MPDYDVNAYQSPNYADGPHVDSRYHVDARRRLKVPAIALMVLSSIGLLMSLFNVGFAVFVEPRVDPTAPELVQSFQRSSTGAVAAAVQLGFAIVNIVVILGTIGMLRLKSYPLAIAASIVAILNLSSCCCVPSLPFAIWCLVVLSNEEVRRGFTS